MGKEVKAAVLLPIVQYWHDKTPPDYIEELLESFREHNPGIPHMVFDESTAEELIAKRLGGREVAAFRTCAVPAMQADYFRYCAALAMGGVYCDADVRCVAGLRATIPPPGEARLFRRPHGAVVNGFFALGSPDHALLDLTLEIATVNIERRSWNEVYMATGPALWTALYWMHQSGSFDAFIASADRGRQKYVRACCEIVSDYKRVTRAFKGVRVDPAVEADPLVRFFGMHFPYKRTNTHWTNVKGDIYRDPSWRTG